MTTFVVAMSLAGCDQNLTTMLHTCDLKRARDKWKKAFIPRCRNRDICCGIKKQWANLKGAKVDAIAVAFAMATLVRCEKISGNINHRMVSWGGYQDQQRRALPCKSVSISWEIWGTEIDRQNPIRRQPLAM